MRHARSEVVPRGGASSVARARTRRHLSAGGGARRIDKCRAGAIDTGRTLRQVKHLILTSGPKELLIVAKPELGTKRLCANCGAKFYDLNKDPITCPKCQTVMELAAVSTRPTRPDLAAAAARAAAPAPRKRWSLRRPRKPNSFPSRRPMLSRRARKAKARRS